MKKMKLYLLKKQPDLYINFDKINQGIILVTGISGSGKSHLSKIIGKQLQLPVVNADFIWGHEKERLPNETEKEILDRFYQKYPENKEITGEQKVEVNEQFFDTVVEYSKEVKQTVILEGVYFCEKPEYINKYINQRMIIKMTPFFITVMQRTKRCIKRSEGKKYRFIQFLKDTKYTLLRIRKWKKIFQNFLEMIEIEEKKGNITVDRKEKQQEMKEITLCE